MNLIKGCGVAEGNLGWADRSIKLDNAYGGPLLGFFPATTGLFSGGDWVGFVPSN